MASRRPTHGQRVVELTAKGDQVEHRRGGRYRGELCDDDALAGWRHKHLLTVERIIGMKPGTGGSTGARYLASTLEKRAFPELWALRSQL